ncbi:hypothetical protein ACYFX5_11090 [Bremerella sp. T1]|uniref:hypothetical protein n=1 Tax=Bremerella sp. TYQ1 TaxID=3119568 RepID=UPI001CC9B6BF|nr:hypothetical protein [Bremerella volcania]UBM38793.1 hypothetical protein LA756_13035 [Bremerella volcania]
MRHSSLVAAAGVVLTLCASVVYAVDLPGFSAGEVELKSAGPLSFAPDNVLIVGDPKAATVYAIQLDKSAAKSSTDLQMPIPDGVSVADLAVSPDTGVIYLSVTENGKPGIVRVDGEKLVPVPLDKVKRAVAQLANAPEDKVVGEGRRRGNRRDESITDVAYVDNQVIVTGRTAGDASAAVHSIAYPFQEEGRAMPIEIYHAAHGRYEDDAVARVFVPFTIGGEPHLLAGFTCTPLVKFPLSAVNKSQEKAYRGTTVAELGNRNRPLDMVVYEKSGNQYLLMANSARGVMKVSTDDIEREEGLTEPVKGGGTAGQDYEAVEWEGVVQLDKLNDNQAVIITQAEGQPAVLKTVDLP